MIFWVVKVEAKGVCSNAYSCEATSPYLQNDRADTANSQKSTQETTQKLDSTQSLQ
ncbi:hypothetical protein Hc94105_1160 [Helicobacter cinaedi]|uniref:hypothetical protein n=1 Tax=Helicobacter cinaedi TaxID=213 RepID=UPI001F165385|nr:hypothetical protein [Helicobacter cinaedi]BDB66958.1 hypothetical protein Hc94105_1160 [Helicobacter cinaedi]